MEHRIRQILATQCGKVDILRKEDEFGREILINTDCYFLAGFAAEDLIQLARQNKMFCMFGVPATNNSHIQIRFFTFA